MQELYYQPIAGYSLDDVTGATDLSGNNNNGASTGFAGNAPPLTSTAVHGRISNSTVSSSFTVPGFAMPGDETKPFTISLSLWFNNNPSNQIVISRGSTGHFDGISVQGNKIYFTMNFVSAPTAQCVYELPFPKKVDVVAVYTERRMQLYVNKELVSQTELTIAQQSDTFYNSANAWKMGGFAAATLVTNNLFFYKRALSQDDVDDIYEQNNTISVDPAVTYGGQTIEFSSSVRKPWQTIEWKTDADWSLGRAVNIGIHNDRINANVISDLTVDGQWYGSVNLVHPISGPNLNSANLWWEGKNVTVQVSLDGTTWVDASRFTNLSNITEGISSSTMTINIKVQTAVGVDESYMNYLKLDIYTNSTIDTQARSVAITNPVTNLFDRTAMERSNDWGIRINGGTLTFPADPSGASNPKTIEMWVNYDTDSSLTVSSNVSSADGFYTNGINTFSVISGQWLVYHLTYNTAISTPFTISGNMTLGRVVLYPRVLSNAEIAEITRAYTGTVTSRVTDSSAIGIAEPTEAYKVYSLNWQDIAATG